MGFFIPVGIIYSTKKPPINKLLGGYVKRVGEQIKQPYFFLYLPLIMPAYRA